MTFTIKKNSERCTDCMLCVKECVSAVWRDVKGTPRAVSPEDCNLCSHCLAVCPQNAIEHQGLDSRQIKNIDISLIKPEIYETIIRGRRSIRQYKNKKIPDELMKKIIDLANHTPTASNSQNIDYIIITEEKRLKTIAATVFRFAVKTFYFKKKFPGNLIYEFIKLFPASTAITRYLDPMQYYIDEAEKGRDFILHNAPALVLVHAPKGGIFSNENCNIAAANIMNYAYSAGLGSCYIGFLNLSLKYNRKLRNLIGLSKKRMVYASIIMGYPAYRHRNTASRKQSAIKWIK